MPIQRRITIPGTVTTASDVILFIANSYDQEFLRKIINLARDRIKGEITEISRREFGLGDQVLFYSKKSGTVYGEIISINRVKCKVKAVSGIIWTVPFTLLQRKG